MSRTTQLDAAVIAALTKARTYQQASQQVVLLLDLLDRVYGRPPTKAEAAAR